MSSEQTIRPILEKTYGKCGTTEALTTYLAEKIDDYDGSDRERMICLTCWDWMTGGSTAAVVAKRIEEALA